MSSLAHNRSDSFVPTVLPRRVTFGQWLRADGVEQAPYFINNHYKGEVIRGFDESGSFAFVPGIGSVCSNVVTLAPEL